MKLSVIPFGISSGRPTATRHVSGLGLDLGARWILVDCGEGTQQQIMRSSLKPSRLDTILLTHLHGDHVLGLPGLLGTLAMDQRSRELTIIGPTGVRRWLEVMLELPILGLSFELRITELAPDSTVIDLGELSGMHTVARRLRHRVPSFGFRFQEPDRPGRIDVDRAVALGIEPGPDLGRLQAGEIVSGIRPEQVMGPVRAGRTVTVLGDTARSEASVELARDADLLVHECTYAAADHDLCEQWLHSCSSDVAWVADRSGAEHVLINHFSARYADPEDLAREVRQELANSSTRVSAAVEGRPVTVGVRD